ncbi:hypothetical protein DFJ74DRAFT_629101 [Hyaloraphidium curvatum]|nr:hypothetical protein DFJ74DRAFT_629101 [Hyaloraphidium curvatum]
MADVAGSALEAPSPPAARKLVSSDPQHLIFAHLRPRRRVFHDVGLGAFLIEHSRARRKGRPPELAPSEGAAAPPPALVPRRHGVLGNVSWQVAAWFTAGSVCWVINGQYVIWPPANPEAADLVTSWSGFVGGLLFWVGAYLAVVEALNDRDGEGFGYELHRLAEEAAGEPAAVVRYLERHHGSKSVPAARVAYTPPHDGWRWIGLQTDSIGWWASVIQYMGATCFTVAVICGLPGVIGPTQVVAENVLVWGMQIAGSIGFVVSSWMAMLEEQEAWWRPALDRIGWHAAFWNLIGSLGFLLCAMFGLAWNWDGTGGGCCFLWGVGFNTYYGSWAFLLASVLMLVERARDRGPGERGAGGGAHGRGTGTVGQRKGRSRGCGGMIDW